MDKINLYHVGFYIIENPILDKGRKNADFGQGFYLSNDLDFVLKWAKFDNDHNTYLNEYELDLKNLNIKYFNKDFEWFSYIYDNRNNFKDIYNNYDLIIGPISNDIIYDVLGITSSNILTKELLYELSKIGISYNQIVIKTDKALKNLKFKNSKILNENDLLKIKKDLKKEEKKFQKEYFKVLNKMI